MVKDLSDFIHKSAVVVLYEQCSHSLILTKRSADLRTHPGEICFPGGGWEAQDKDLWSTALRELNEELGIEPKRVQYMSQLAPEKTLVNVEIHPWLATIAAIDPYVINQNEVADIILLPINKAICRKNYQDIVVSRYGMTLKSCQFTGCEHFVWGATARIMKQLCQQKGLLDSLKPFQR